jgi:serine/threonine protein kinase
MEAKVGTPGYQAPETAANSVVTPAIDMWALGVILHELATG